LRIEVVPGEKEHKKRHHREKGEQFIAAGKLIEQTPRGAGVPPVNELEEAVYDHFFLRVAEVFEQRPAWLSGRVSTRRRPRWPFVWSALNSYLLHTSASHRAQTQAHWLSPAGLTGGQQNSRSAGL